MDTGNRPRPMNFEQADRSCGRATVARYRGAAIHDREAWGNQDEVRATWDRRAVLEDEAAPFRPTRRAFLGGRDDPRPYRRGLGARVWACADGSSDWAASRRLSNGPSNATVLLCRPTCGLQ